MKLAVIAILAYEHTLTCEVLQYMITEELLSDMSDTHTCIPPYICPNFDLDPVQPMVYEDQLTPPDELK